MKKMVLGIMVLGMLCGLPACTGANANIAENQWWVTFLKEEVVKVQEIYPDGDVPKSLVTTKSGKKMIF